MSGKPQLSTTPRQTIRVRSYGQQVALPGTKSNDLGYYGHSYNLILDTNRIGIPIRMSRGSLSALELKYW